MSKLIIIDTPIDNQKKRLAVQVEDIDSEDIQVVLLRGGATIVKIEDMDVLLEGAK